MNKHSAWRPLYLDVAPDPVFAVFHPSPGGATQGTAVLLSPPWGWDEVTTYRSRRAWAEHLAAAGHPTLRFDFPGSGDSGGSSEDPQRLEAWIESIREAATWLRDSTGCGQIAAVGVGLGGLIAGKAIAEGAPIDDLVLWGTPATGRSFIREERAFSRFQDTRFSMTGEPEPVLLPEGWMEAGGFVLSAATMAGIESLSLRTMATGTLRRALLLERDGIGVDDLLRQHLTAAGVAVTVAPGNGWGAMTMFVDRYRPPLEVFAQVTSWLGEAPVSTAAVGKSSVVARDAVEIRLGTGTVRESALMVQRPFGRLFAVLAEPVDVPPASTCAVFLNAGAVRRTGPNRLWVDASRRWAARGLPALRIDLEGLGDSDGEAGPSEDVGKYYVSGLLEQVLSFLDGLEDRGFGPRFLLVGLCSGGYWAFQAAAHEPRVTAAVVLNAGALVWDDDLVRRRDARKLYRLFDPAWLRRIVRGEINRTRMREIALAFAGRARPGGGVSLDRRSDRRIGELPDPLDATLDTLHEAGTRVVLAFSADEAVRAELDESGALGRLEGRPNIELVTLPGRDHTVRPIVAQRAVHDLLDREFALELERASQAADVAGGGPAIHDLPDTPDS